MDLTGFLRKILKNSRYLKYVHNVYILFMRIYHTMLNDK